MSGVVDLDVPSTILFRLLRRTIFRRASSFAISFGGGEVMMGGDAKRDGGGIEVEGGSGRGAGADVGCED